MNGRRIAAIGAVLAAAALAVGGWLWVFRFEADALASIAAHDSSDLDEKYAACVIKAGFERFVHL